MKPTKSQHRARRHNRIRSRVTGTPARPRLCVYRSLTHIYAQLIDDTQGKILAQSSSLKMKKAKGVVLAKSVGLELADKAKAVHVETCVFDRGGYLYHGRVKALADGAREGGLQF